jgi:hypothetical protein
MFPNIPALNLINTKLLADCTCTDIYHEHDIILDSAVGIYVHSKIIHGTSGASWATTMENYARYETQFFSPGRTRRNARGGEQPGH